MFLCVPPLHPSYSALTPGRTYQCASSGCAAEIKCCVKHVLLVWNGSVSKQNARFWIQQPFRHSSVEEVIISIRAGICTCASCAAQMHVHTCTRSLHRMYSRRFISDTSYLYRSRPLHDSLLPLDSYLNVRTYSLTRFSPSYRQILPLSSLE